MYRDVCNHNVGDQKLLEHICPYVSLLQELARRSSTNPGPLYCRLNQLSFDTVKISSAFCSERANNKNVHFISPHAR